jgi:transposase
MHGRTFSREFKLEVVRQIVSGQKRCAQVCREHQLAETVLLRWRREYEERGEAAFTPKEVASSQLSAEVRVAE